jgi:hypothetical protein
MVRAFRMPQFLSCAEAPRAAFRRPPRAPPPPRAATHRRGQGRKPSGQVGEDRLIHRFRLGQLLYYMPKDLLDLRRER